MFCNLQVFSTAQIRNSLKPFFLKIKMKSGIQSSQRCFILLLHTQCVRFPRLAIYASMMERGWIIEANTVENCRDYHILNDEEGCQKYCSNYWLS